MSNSHFEEKFYAGLNDFGRWEIFVSRAEDATPEKTGYIAVTAGYAFRCDIEEVIKQLPEHSPIGMYP